jgi:hypothetical protein
VTGVDDGTWRAAGRYSSCLCVETAAESAPPLATEDGIENLDVAWRKAQKNGDERYGASSSASSSRHSPLRSRASNGGADASSDSTKKRSCCRSVSCTRRGTRDNIVFRVGGTRDRGFGLFVIRPCARTTRRRSLPTVGGRAQTEEGSLGLRLDRLRTYSRSPAARAGSQDRRFDQTVSQACRLDQTGRRRPKEHGSTKRRAHRRRLGRRAS